MILMISYEVLLPVGAAIIWSANPPVIYRFARDTAPSVFTFIRSIMAIVFLTIFLVLNGSGLSLYLAPSILFYMILSGILGPGLGDMAYTKAIQLIGGPLAITISYSYIFFAQLFASMFFNEQLSILAITGGALSFAGIYLAVSGNNHRGQMGRIGFMYSIAAAVLWGLGASMIRMFRDHADVYTTAIIRLVAVALLSLFISSARKHPVSLSRSLIIATFYTGVLSWGVGMILFIQSIYTIGVSVTSVATALAPVLTQFINKVITRERISPRILAGAFLVSMGIVLTVL